jgi:hypothetical protein
MREPIDVGSKTKLYTMCKFSSTILKICLVAYISVLLFATYNYMESKSTRSQTSDNVSSIDSINP